MVMILTHNTRDDYVTITQSFKTVTSKCRISAAEILPSSNKSWLKENQSLCTLQKERFFKACNEQIMTAVAGLNSSTSQPDLRSIRLWARRLRSVTSVRRVFSASTCLRYSLALAMESYSSFMITSCFAGVTRFLARARFSEKQMSELIRTSVLIKIMENSGVPT
ncbi:hypothetical protein MPTK1_5g19680 [Marchantia polymorpha subsp. ruderalis]|uniref:Uncharacterized protein n=2 Tax=Marchantia polymorpha TaxID=3197 RepID=A0AAF6BK56_MARPO|nr:hypothetical protein MARPO_0134s0026 [Marchantia polymorpha]BBN12390.1 hypothetical protein Mp_5g19680 [Marchantia polymorpha subsp. ruderalis]|eukprot:PTQ29815.1 hypothetical protein MARPO_0134s0026 [Marchantia polymorpha]